MGEIYLTVNGKRYSGWKSARVTRGIEAIAGSFALTAADRWADLKEPWPILEGDACEVSIGGERLISGYVDVRAPSYSATDMSLSIEGRDQTADLVDCSALLDKWEFKGLTLEKFVSKVCEPFGISVAVQAGLAAKLPKPPKKFSIDPGDTAFSTIENACRVAGALAISDGAGGLILTHASTERCTTELVQGENILSAGGRFDVSGRFREYRVLAQHKGDADLSGEQSAGIKGTATDQNIARSERVLIIRPEKDCTADYAKKRAQWEAASRAGRGDQVTITVQGWTQKDRTLWPINKLCRVRSPRLRVDGDLLITQATYEVGSGGTTTTLTLKPLVAFAPEPVITVAASRGLWNEVIDGALTVQRPTR